jgi:hypothetical protein
MVTTEESGFEGLVEIRDIIEAGGKNITADCISQRSINEAILFDHPELDLGKGQIRKVMMKLGYSKRSKRIYINGSALWVWLHHQMSNDEIRDSWQIPK